MRISGRGKWRMFLILLCFIMLGHIIKLVVLQATPSIHLNEGAAFSMALSSTT